MHLRLSWTAIALAAAAAGACGGTIPVRKMVDAQRWYDACQIFKTEDPKVDMERWEFMRVVRERSGVRIGLHLVTPEALRGMLGLAADAAERLQPVHWRTLALLGSASSSLPRDPLADEFAVLALRLDRGAGIHGLAVEPGAKGFIVKRHRRDPRVLSALDTATTEVMGRAIAGVGVPPDPRTLARALGYNVLVEGASSSGTGKRLSGLGFLLDIVVAVGTVGTLDLNLRRDASGEGLHKALLTRSGTAAPTTGPTPETYNRKLVDRLLAMTRQSCADAKRPCTETYLLRYDSIHRANWITLSLAHTLRGAQRPSETCSQTSYLELPIPPQRPLPEAIDALFAAGPRPVAELERLGDTVPTFTRCTSSSDCTPLAGATTEACPRSLDCLIDGRCAAEEGRCVEGKMAGPRRYTSATKDCGISKCWIFGTCTKVASGACIAGGDADCQQSSNCEQFGACRQERVSGGCAVSLTGDCRQAKVCLRYGWCSAVEGRCQAASDDDCAASRACKLGGECRAEAGRCAATAGGCRASDACRTYGLCKLVEGACAASSSSDCAGSRLCRTFGTCRATDRRCVE